MGNVIAFAASSGVIVSGATTIGNSIRGNSIFDNGYLGIDLNNDGVTLNDSGDSDVGPNNLQNFPELASASVSSGTTILSGTLNSTPNRTFLIDVYRNSAADPSGYGEGEDYVGSTSANTDTSGNAIFGLAVSGNFTNQYFTATATDTTTGDTSEFNRAKPAIVGNGPPALSGPFAFNSSGFTLKLTTLETNRVYRVQASTNLVSWIDLTNFIPGVTNLIFSDATGTNFHHRFYRVVSP